MKDKKCIFSDGFCALTYGYMKKDLKCDGLKEKTICPFWSKR